MAKATPKALREYEVGVRIRNTEHPLHVPKSSNTVHIEDKDVSVTVTAATPKEAQRLALARFGTALEPRARHVNLLPERKESEKKESDPATPPVTPASPGASASTENASGDPPATSEK